MSDEDLKRRFQNLDLEGMSNEEFLRARDLIEKETLEEIEESNRRKEQEHEEATRIAAERQTEAREMRDYWQILEDEGLEHVRQPNEGPEDYSPLPKSINVGEE